MDLQFGDIQETALITLAIRASETSRPNARIRDPKAKEIIDALGVDVSKFDPFLSHEGVVARTIIFREELKRLLKKYPDAVCINLGCGFDDKFSQVDNGRLTWFDVDLPDQIAVRRKVFEDRDRCTMMDGDALDGAWTKNIPKSDMSEQHSPFLEKHGSHHDAVKHTNASFGWGTKSGKEYLSLEPRLKYISEKSYNEEMKKYTIRGKLFAVIGKNINNRMAVFSW